MQMYFFARYSHFSECQQVKGYSSYADVLSKSEVLTLCQERMFRTVSHDSPLLGLAEQNYYLQPWSALCLRWAVFHVCGAFVGCCAHLHTSNAFPNQCTSSFFRNMFVTCMYEHRLCYTAILPACLRLWYVKWIFRHFSFYS